MSYTAKSVVIDIADNWGDSYMGFRQCDFYYNDSKIELDESTDFTAYSTSNYSTTPPEWGFDTDTSYIGKYSSNGWMSSNQSTNQRVVIVFDSEQTFDSIVFNNNHGTSASGSGNTDRGIKNFKITISDDEITDTTYDAAISNSTLIFDGQIREHVAADIQDDIELTLLPPPTVVSIPEIKYLFNVDAVKPRLIIPIPEIRYLYNAEMGSLTGGSALVSIPEIKYLLNIDSVKPKISVSVPEIQYLYKVAEPQIKHGYFPSIPEIKYLFNVDAVKPKLNIPVPEIKYILNAGLKPNFSIPVPEIIYNYNISMPQPKYGYFPVIPEISYVIDIGSIKPNISIPVPEISYRYSLAVNPNLIIPVPEIKYLYNVNVPPEGIITFSTGSAIIRYFCTITGSADSTTDITIPMSSFQARRRADADTFLQVVIPSIDYISAISARSNGTILIQQGYELNGEIKQISSIIETTIDEIGYDQGTVNQSLTLTGYKTSTYSAKLVDLSGATYKSNRGGTIRYRLAKPYIFLNPGDTVTIQEDGYSFEVASMTYYVSALEQRIELEAA